jgi:hypothetical protein
MAGYQTAFESMKGLVALTENPMKSFNKNTYAQTFNHVYEQMLPAFDAIEELYKSVGEPDTMISNMAAAFVDEAVSCVSKGKNRREQEMIQMNLNMQLAVYVYPSILHYRGQSSQPLADAIGVQWKKAFPKSNVSQATVDSIQDGFKRKFCYITTAVCRTFGKPDDCYELSLLRDYRDGYLASQENGEELIRMYYDQAPSIVKHIDRRDNASEIYRSIWDTYLSECIGMIENGELENCRDLYIRMVEDLRKEYFS